MASTSGYYFRNKNKLNNGSDVLFPAEEASADMVQAEVWTVKKLFLESKLVRGSSSYGRKTSELTCPWKSKGDLGGTFFVFDLTERNRMAQ